MARKEETRRWRDGAMHDSEDARRGRGAVKETGNNGRHGRHGRMEEMNESECAGREGTQEKEECNGEMEWIGTPIIPHVCSKSLFVSF